jgi:hypothetical protein
MYIRTDSSHMHGQEPNHVFLPQLLLIGLVQSPDVIYDDGRFDRGDSVMDAVPCFLFFWGEIWYITRVERFGGRFRVGGRIEVAGGMSGVRGVGKKISETNSAEVVLRGEIEWWNQERSNDKSNE